MSTQRQNIHAMESAMQWLLRLREDRVTEADITAWMEWYEADEANKKAFDEVQEFWHFTGGLAEGEGGAQRIARLQRRLPLNLRPGHRRSLVPLALAATILLIAMASVYWATREGMPALSESAVVNVRKQHLPDGSEMQLAARTTVAVDYSEQQRLLTLESGEAHFIVAPNPARPFVVQVGELRVHAIGTAFNIRKAAQRVVVTVDDGAVQISSPDFHAVKIEAGKEARWEKGSAKPIARPADIARALAWQEGRLEYIEEPLSAVIADLNRYGRRRVLIQDEAAGHLTFTGTIFTESTEEWLQALPHEFPLDLVVKGDDILLSSR